MAEVLDCEFHRVPYTGDSFRFDIPPTDSGSCSFKDGLEVFLITWPTPRALEASVELTPGLFNDYPDDDYYLAQGRGWTVTQERLAKPGPDRALSKLEGRLIHYTRLGQRTTPAPTPFE